MKELNLSTSQVMKILLRALDHIDVRLVDHGHRVAYIVYKMMQADGSYSEKEMQEICIVAALHDIGAYKTEEIDQMVQFESVHVFDHSIYGYLFLKHMSPLRKWAEVILYHHFNYGMYWHPDRKHLKIADMIHLADRVDIMLQNGAENLSLEAISRKQNLRFSKTTMELFQKAGERYDLNGDIKNGSYLNELVELISTAEYNEETLLEYIKMIAYSIDFRSETTVSHVITTVSISRELGKLFGLNDHELKKIQLGAYLHDIGKIATPLAILEKPGGLTHEEMLVMREHIETTGEILRGRIHDEILKIAYRHHEKIDGSGYPNHLKADELKLSERIVAVADMMSALTGKRSYKESFPKETVIEIMEKQKETGKLCGRVIDSAIRHYDHIM
ncbi:MAG: HD domain-containing protein [Eubacteriales bacterium]|nr:HD domain-containing protein [Eubacteriales bacterium]